MTSIQRTYAAGKQQERRARILELLRANPEGLPALQISAAVGSDPSTVVADLRALSDWDVIERIDFQSVYKLRETPA